MNDRRNPDEPAASRAMPPMDGAGGEDRGRAEDAEIESRLLEALDGPPATRVTAETWEAITEEGLRRLEARSHEIHGSRRESD